jgi:hypothetical protein
MMRRRGARRISALGAFVIQACYISWAAWLPAALLGAARGYVPYVGSSVLAGGLTLLDSTHTAVAVLFLLGSYGPLLAGLGISARLGGREGARALFGRVLHWRLAPRWYGIAVGLPVIIVLPAMAVARLAGVAPASPGWPSNGWLVTLLVLFYLLTISTAEFGWRGIALALAQRRYPAEQAAYIVGAAWTLWMLPYLGALYAGQDAGTGLFLHLIGWTIYLLGASVIHTWLYNSTSSLWLCMLYSAISMSVWTLATGVMGWHALPQLVLGLTSWLVALVVVRRYGGARLASESTPGSQARIGRR